MTLPSQEDSRLIIAAREGSPEALSAVFDRYAGRLHALVRLRLGPRLRLRLESRDIVQEALLKAFEGIHRFEGSGSRSLMAWLGTIAVDVIRNEAKYHGRLKRDMGRDTTVDGKADFLAAEIRSQVSLLQIDRDAARLEQAIETLSEDHREIILLRSFEELTFPEISERLGRSSDACRMLYGRAMFALVSKMRGAAPTLL